MDTMSLFISCRPFSVYLSFLLLAALTYQSLSLNEKFLACAPKSCGNGPNISYPFRISGVHESYCGYPNFDVTCNSGDFPVLTLPFDDFLIKDIFYTNQSFQLASASLYEEDDCPAPLHNLTLDRTPFSISPDSYNLSFFYNCTTEPTNYPHYPVSCHTDSSLFSFALFNTDILESQANYSLASCPNSVSVPLHINGDYDGKLTSLNYTEVLKAGFLLNWTAPNCSTCERSGGRCGFENNEFVCFCSGSFRSGTCFAGSGSTRAKVYAILGAIAVIGTLLACGLSGLMKRKIKQLLAPRKNKDFEAFLEKYGPRDVKRYSYLQVKKMTNSFREKLGQGGYGSVYKGTLPEGRLVAVKLLSSSEDEGAQGFLNEVATISRTSHVNIVSLLGFCLNTHKRALVYEFMPNGSLDKFIGSENSQQLGWEMLHKISIGIAQGLEYLHRGCNTRIVHFDIKPQNVLLDENLTPKISDFGLAKLCTRKESKVSMLEARGTIGYIAPEVFCINFGQVSSKSDVYSFGMMILEMAGGRNKDAQQVEGNDSSEMYFPGWIYRSLVLENEDEDISEDNDEFVRKLKLVGLWCIQTNPSDRPTMSKVVEMLQGSIQALEIPPKPFLSSSPALQFPLYSSTASTVDLGLLPSAKASHLLVL